MSTGKKCANCGKGVMYGHSMSHAKNRANRTFAPNLHTMRIPIGIVMKPTFAKASTFANASADKSAGKRVRLCTKCLRMLKGKSRTPKTPETLTATV